MYKMCLIGKNDIKIKIPCEKCLNKGYIDNYCTMCGKKLEE